MTQIEDQAKPTVFKLPPRERATLMLGDYHRLEIANFNKALEKKLTTLDTLFKDNAINGYEQSLMKKMIKRAYDVELGDLLARHKREMAALHCASSPITKALMLSDHSIVDNYEARAQKQISDALKKLKDHQRDQLNALREKHSDYEASLEHALFSIGSQSITKTEKRKEAITLYQQRLKLLKVTKSQELDELHYTHFEELTAVQNSLDPLTLVDKIIAGELPSANPKPNQPAPEPPVSTRRPNFH